MVQHLQTRLAQGLKFKRGIKISEKTDETSVDPDIERLDNKTKEGALNVVHGVLADPEVQGLIKEALLRETIKNSVILSCLLIGLLKLYDVAKTITGFDWRGDLLMSVSLITIGLVYMLRNLLCSPKHPDRIKKGNDNKA